FNLLIDSKFPYQPKALWLTRLRLQPLRCSAHQPCALRWYVRALASGGVGDDPVAAVALGPVEGLVGALENGFRAVVGLRDRRDSDREGALDGPRALEDGERLAGDAPPDALGHHRRHRHVGLRHDHDELLAAEAAGEIDAADRLAHAGGELAQPLVAA